MPLPSSDRHRPPLSKRVSECCSRFYPPCPVAAPGRWAGRAQLPGAQISVTSRKGALLRRASVLHLSRTLLVSPPLRGLRLGSGKERPHPRAVLSPQRRRHGSPVARDPCPRPRLGKFPVLDSGGRWSFALSCGAQTPGRLPKPRCAGPRRPSPRLPQPAEADKGLQDAGAAFRSSAAPKPLLAGSGESSQGGVLMERVSHQSLSHR